MKKKILLLSDDIRTYTGVGIMSKHLIVGTSHKYDWVQLSAKSVHEEAGSIVDVSESVNKLTGLTDSYVRLYPSSGYGDEHTLRGILTQESPDMILTFTDPRFWNWFHKLEREVRQNIPIAYYHVWDNYPYPHFNQPIYDSCDWIGCISKLTYDVVNTVCPHRESWQTTYVPHGICSDTFHPMDDSRLLTDYKSTCIPGGDNIEFIALCNNANLRRKQIPDVIFSFKSFCDTLPNKQRSKVALILHTNPMSSKGCNVYDIVNSLGDEYNIYVSEHKLSDTLLNYLYNIADVTINLASAEGFGLTTLESLMSGTPIISNQTGGLVDQSGTLTESDWVYKLLPSVRNIVGSQSVPYIYEDICSRSHVVDALRHWYELDPEQRKRCGLSGRNFVKTTFGLSNMITPFIEGIDNTFKNFTPRSRFDCTLVTNTNQESTFTDKGDFT